MSTFHIQNFGCRATQADAAAIEWQLRTSGCEPASDARTAEVVVFNTCTVTAAADLQARQAIAAAAKQNPGANIIVTGCYAQRAPEDLASLPAWLGWWEIRTRMKSRGSLGNLAVVRARNHTRTARSRRSALSRAAFDQRRRDPITRRAGGGIARSAD